MLHTILTYISIAFYQLSLQPGQDSFAMGFIKFLFWGLFGFIITTFIANIVNRIKHRRRKRIDGLTLNDWCNLITDIQGIIRAEMSKVDKDATVLLQTKIITTFLIDTTPNLINPTKYGFTDYRVNYSSKLMVRMETIIQAAITQRLNKLNMVDGVDMAQLQKMIRQGLIIHGAYCFNYLDRGNFRHQIQTLVTSE